MAQTGTHAGSIELGNGFCDHGVATPIANHRGTVATVDGEGRNVVLLWLYDSRGGYALLMIDAESGQAEQFPMPFDPGGDGPFASILSSRNLFYTHFNSHFCEFDPARRAFTFSAESVPQMAMGMTEADDGRIWSVTYPKSGVVSFDPQTREFRDYGHVYDQNWAQYQRAVACDAAGWLYFGVGSTLGQIVALEPESGEAFPIVPECDRVQGTGFVYRNLDGRVYGHGGASDRWLKLFRGQAEPVGAHSVENRKPIVTDSQSLFHRVFPDGTLLRECSLVERTLTTEHPETGATHTVAFDYSTEGAHIMGACAAPDRTICGGTAFPMRFFSYNPGTDTWVNRPAYGQFNTVTTHGDRFFVGGYGHGFLLEWDPQKPWVDSEKGKPGNPQHHVEAHPDINRPHDLIANDELVVMAGTPGYGYTGGGLLVWDRREKQADIVPHTELVTHQAPKSLVFLSGQRLLVGMTIAAGTGGEVKADEAEMLEFDLAARRVTWHSLPIRGVKGYHDMCMAPDGLVYGIADSTVFFVFDPDERRIVHQRDIEAEVGRAVLHQGTRAFVPAEDGTMYFLLNRGIAAICPSTYAIEVLAESPVPVQQGGAILDGRLYFIQHSHLYSWTLPDAGRP